MSRLRSKLRAYLELSRISNLPTVWANVMVGYAIAMHAVAPSNTQTESALPASSGWLFSLPPWAAALLAAVAVSLLYIGGMALNDAADAPHDAAERSARPIPSGRIRRSTAYRFVLVCFILGLVLLALLHWMALLFGWGLVLVIMVYDFTHKQFARAVIVMGICRFLVYFVAAAAVNPRFDLLLTALLGAVLGAYTVAITLVARAETKSSLDVRRWLAVIMPIGVLAIAAERPPDEWTWTLIAGAALALWLALPIRFVFTQPPQTIKAVLCWLSGMCLVDAYFLTLLGQPMVALAAGACFALTAWGHRHIMGT